MKKGATTGKKDGMQVIPIIALRNEKGSYNQLIHLIHYWSIIALRNEKGSYNLISQVLTELLIIALRNEKGSYNINTTWKHSI